MGSSFNTHVHEDHNMWQYIFFIVHLFHREATETNGPETFVRNKIRDSEAIGTEVDISWLPRYNAIVLAKKNEENSVVAQLNEEINSVKEEIEWIKASASKMKTTVTDLLDTVKEIEAQRRAPS